MKFKVANLRIKRLVAGSLATGGWQTRLLKISEAILILKDQNQLVSTIIPVASCQ